MPFLTYDPFPQCLQQSPLTPLLLARGTSEEVGAIYQTLSISPHRLSKPGRDISADGRGCRAARPDQQQSIRCGRQSLEGPEGRPRRPMPLRLRPQVQALPRRGGFYREVRIRNLPKGLHLGGASWPGPTASSTSTSDAPSSASSRPAPPWARSPPGSGDTPPPSTASWAGTASATATAAFAATSP